MPSEATAVEQPTIVKQMTCENSIGISKGTLLWLQDNNKVSTASAINVPFAGIAYEDKKADDGATKISVAKDGVWLIYSTSSLSASTFAPAGMYVKISGQNGFVAISEATLGNITTYPGEVWPLQAFYKGMAIGRLREDASSVGTRYEVELMGVA